MILHYNDLAIMRCVLLNKKKEYGKMNNTLTTKNRQTIEKALKNKVISENISEKLELEEIMYLNRLKLATNSFTIESALSKYLDEFPHTSNDYKYYINFLAAKEDDMKTRTDKILFNALKNMPAEIKDFISLFLINNLYQNSNEIEKKCKAIKNSTECTSFINNLEKRLGFSDAFMRLNVTRYIKKKFSYFQDYYYIDLINAYTNSTAVGLLYAIQGR